MFVVLLCCFCLFADFKLWFVFAFVCLGFLALMSLLLIIILLVFRIADFVVLLVCRFVCCCFACVVWYCCISHIFRLDGLWGVCYYGLLLRWGGCVCVAFAFWLGMVFGWFVWLVVCYVC